MADTRPRLVTLTSSVAGAPVISFDASLNESHSRDTEITSHPIERGSEVSDHVIRLPVCLQIEAFFTDSPVDVGQSARIFISSPLGFLSDVAAIAGPLAVPLGIIATPLGLISNSVAGAAAIVERNFDTPTVSFEPGTTGYEGRAFELYKTLELFQDRSDLLVVDTVFKSYSNMVIQSLSAPRDKNINRRGVRFNIVLREIQIVDAQTVTIKGSARGQAKASNGPKSAPPAKPTLRSAGKKLGDLFGFTIPDSGLGPGDPGLIGSFLRGL